MAFPLASNVNNPACWGYGASIDKGSGGADLMYLRLADSPQRISGIQTTNEPGQLPSTAQNPEDVAAGAGQTFSRTQFSGGEGLDRAHRQSNDPDFDASRYWDSRNIDISPASPGTPEEVTLLKAVAQWRTSTNTNHHTAVIGTALYWGEGSDVKRTADPTATTPTVTSEDPEAGETARTVSGLAALGDELYAAIGATGIHKRSSGGTWAAWSDLDCSGGKIWSVKGRIIAASAAALYEAGTTSTSTLLHTLPSGQTWNDVVDAGTAILAAASDGQIYLWADEAGTLVKKNEETFEGEVPISLGMSQGVLFVGTGVDTTAGGKIGRLWIGEVVGQKIHNLQVVRVWGSGTETRDRAPRSFLPTRDSIFFSVLEDATENHLWRFHIATAGLTRDLIFTESAICQGLQVIDDRLFAFFSGADGWRELTTFAATGWLIGPLVDHFTSRPKIQVGLRLDCDIPVTQETITLKYSTNPDALLSSAHASWTNGIAFTSSTTQLLIDAETAISDIEARYLTTQLVLAASTDATTAPTVFSYAQRSLLATEDLTVRVYVNVSDTIKKFGYKATRIPGQGRRLWTELNDNWLNKSLVLTLLRPSLQVRGQIVSMSTPIQGHTDRGELTTFAILDVQGIKV